MATRANIIVQTGPKTFKLIYTHSDGYPEWMGVYLDRFHNSYAAAKEIVSLGDLSALDCRLSPNPGEFHDWDRNAAFCSVFFGRDRESDSSDHKAATYRSLEAALEVCGNYAVYVWVKGTVGWTFALVDDRTVCPHSLIDLAFHVRTNPACVSKREDMDENGLTLEWRDGGCPHKTEPGPYRDHHTPMPLDWLSEVQKRQTTYEEKALF